MKYIKLFLASSAVEFEQERNELGSYIRMLNDIYAKRGIYFELTIWDDLPDAVTKDRKEDECSHEIRNSQYFYVLFGKDAGEDTIQEFNVALELFRKSGAPHIYTYFRKLPEGQSASQSVKNFMERLDQEIGHYYSTFTHLDAVKLNMLLELTRNSDLNSNLKFEDGEAKLDGKPVLDLGNVPIYSKNEELQKRIAEKRRLDEEFANLRVAMITAPEDDELFSRLMDVSKQRNQLSDQIHQMEMSILDLCSTVSEMSASGHPLTWREKKAVQLLDAGDYQGALAILNDVQRQKELEQAKEVAKNGLNRIRGYISENRLNIKTLTSQGITKQTIGDLDACYEESVKLAEEYRIELNVLYDYADFLWKLHRYSKGIAVAERLKKYFELEQAPEDDQATLKNLLGIFYSDTNQFKEAEDYFQEALKICRKLAKENPEAYEGYVAATCNNLGVLYRNINRMKEAEGYFLEALKIYHKLAKENPEAYEGCVAGTCNNLGGLYQDINWSKEAEEYYRKALEIRRRLAKENPKAYEKNVAETCNNLGTLYSDTNRRKEAEEYYQEALIIYHRLAKENPEAYEVKIATICNNLGALYSDTNRRKEAEEYYQEALIIYHRLAKENPEVYEVKIATICYNLGNFYSDTNQTEEAEKSYQEALELYRKLTKENPEVYKRNVAAICNNLGVLYDDTNRNKEAEEYYQEALEIRRGLVKMNPELFEEAVANTSCSLAALYFKEGQKEKSKPYFENALTLFEKNPSCADKALMVREILSQYF